MTGGIADRLLARTIWARGRFGTPPDRYANIHRIILPLFDLAMFIAGVGAIIYGSPAFVDISDGDALLGLGWGVWTTVAALLCMVGLSFPRLVNIEAVGKSMLAASCVVYLSVLFLLTGGGSTTRFVAGGVSVAALLLASWRLGDIRIEVLEERARHQQDGDGA